MTIYARLHELLEELGPMLDAERTRFGAYDARIAIVATSYGKPEARVEIQGAAEPMWASIGEDGFVFAHDDEDHVYRSRADIVDGATVRYTAVEKRPCDQGAVLIEDGGAK